jgi:sugar transferase (PEP-CTERM/EpsH1 system associated)
MRIRIMHVVHGLGRGGLENGLANLIEQLNPGEFEHLVLPLRGLGPNAKRIANRAQILNLSADGPRSRVQVPAIARSIRAFKPHLVHSRNWAAIDAVFAARWVRSCAIVHSEHGLESDGVGEEPWRRALVRRLAFQLADRVLSVSDQLRNWHSARTGFSSHKITVVHNGVDIQRFAPSAIVRARIRQELGLSDGEFCIGCIGNLFPIKDHLTLLRAADELGEIGASYRLLLIGEGPELSALQHFVKSRSALSMRVNFLGSSNRVPELLNAMDTYVLPSIAEGISNSLLEAMATGLPVAATAVGGTPEVVVNGESGLLFPARDFTKLANILLLLRSQQELCRKLGEGARRRVIQSFSLQSMVNKYEAIYRTTAGAGLPQLAAAHR